MCVDYECGTWRVPATTWHCWRAVLVWTVVALVVGGSSYVVGLLYIWLRYIPEYRQCLHAYRSAMFGPDHALTSREYQLLRSKGLRWSLGSPILLGALLCWPSHLVGASVGLWVGITMLVCGMVLFVRSYGYMGYWSMVRSGIVFREVERAESKSNRH